MKPILFYGVPEGCSFGSIVALEWSGLPYRLCRVPMPEVVSGAGYKRINPVGETPAFMTGTGALLSESMAILNHIGHRWLSRRSGEETGGEADGEGLAFAQGSAQDNLGFDRLNQMLAFLNTGFFGAFGPLWYALERGSEGTAKQALTDCGRTLAAKAHGDLERMLEGKAWLLGARRSLADAYFAGIARWADFHRVVERRDYPAVQRLYARLQDDPAVRFAWAVEHEEPAESAGGFAGHVSLAEALRCLKGEG